MSVIASNVSFKIGVIVVNWLPVKRILRRDSVLQGKIIITQIGEWTQSNKAQPPLGDAYDFPNPE